MVKNCILIGILTSIIGLPLAANASQTGEVYRQTKASTALIAAVDGASDSISLGSGFFVGHEGLLVTNAHVVEEYTRLIVYAGGRTVYLSPEMVAVDPDLDLAALHIHAAVNGLSLSRDLPEEGTSAIASGYPRLPDILEMGFTLHPTVTPSTVSGVAMGHSRLEGNPALYIQTTGMLNRGNSGGPLVRLDTGEVTGMVVHTVPYLERAKDGAGNAIGRVMLRAGISYSIPAQVIHEWLVSQQIMSNPSQDTQQPSVMPTDTRDSSPKKGKIGADPERSFATAHLLHTIAVHLKDDPHLLKLAVRHYESSVSLQPQAFGTIRNMGLAYAALGRWEKALEVYENVLEQIPPNSALLTDIGWIWERRGKLGRAESYYRQAVEVNPCDAHAHTVLGLLFQKRGEGDESLREFRKALECDPQSIHAAYNLGIALEAKGRPEETIQVWKPILQRTGLGQDSTEIPIQRMRQAVSRLTPELIPITPNPFLVKISW